MSNYQFDTLFDVLGTTMHTPMSMAAQYHMEGIEYGEDQLEIPSLEMVDVPNTFGHIKRKYGITDTCVSVVLETLYNNFIMLDLESPGDFFLSCAHSGAHGSSRCFEMFTMDERQMLDSDKDELSEMFDHELRSKHQFNYDFTIFGGWINPWTMIIIE